MRDALGIPQGTPLCLKPADMGDGLGVALINTPKDMQLYAQALTSPEPVIPANTLSEPHK